ncbi:preprotein translocase subunit SecE [Geodermatophilus poikilotrophus]|uniref:Protein translocase subunit SecE n=1 Tax=Geodermatophilus poikilotrophus TaxID=1333667 RepID=A0A1I0HBW0_9ACTN|nr:preprotein translocase subunit SecE [Geodermatophilus poikilotrophus]SET81127.1 protein translocase subunit secE/sec61 gamma [Geodermatophilus poikilotrophus]
MSDEKPAREGDPRAASDAEPTDEQLDREAPGVADAAELQAAEAEVAAEAETDEDKVVASRPTGARRGSRITAGDDEDDDESAPRTRRAARGRAPSRPAGRAAEGGATRSRAAAERDRAAEARQRRDIRRFLREVVAELRKVIWPGRRELITYTTVVIVFVAFIVALVAGLDLLFAQGVLAVFG